MGVRPVVSCACNGGNIQSNRYDKSILYIGIYKYTNMQCNSVSYPAV